MFCVVVTQWDNLCSGITMEEFVVLIEMKCVLITQRDVLCNGNKRDDLLEVSLGDNIFCYFV